MKNIIFKYSLLIIFLIATGCEKFLEIDVPKQNIAAVQVFSSKETAEAAVVGVFSRMTASNNFLMNGFFSLYMSLAADDLWNTTTSAVFDPFKNNALLNTNTTIANGAWNIGYNYIYHINAIIEGIKLTSHIEENEKAKLLGEVYFSRAFVYFYLVHLFGEIPLITQTDYEENRLKPKAKVIDIHKQIMDDLLLAEQNIPEEYLYNHRLRPNKYAVKALLARVYLYKRDYNNALLKSTEVIENRQSYYELLNDLNGVFLANSKEAIWQLYPTILSYNSSEGLAFIPTSATARPPHAIYDGLKNSFEPGDHRMESWLKNQVVSGVSYLFPYKFKVRASTTITEYNTALRLSEQYLIRAEALVHLDQAELAVKDINKVRFRAGLLNLDEDIGKEAAILAVIQERRVEFFAEWGHRWFDLVRLGIIDEEMLKTKPTWKGDNILFPIPEAEILKNPFLK